MYEYISGAEVTSEVASVTISDIPQTYKSLEVWFLAKASSNWTYPTVLINGSNLPANTTIGTYYDGGAMNNDSYYNNSTYNIRLSSNGAYDEFVLSHIIFYNYSEASTIKAMSAYVSHPSNSGSRMSVCDRVTRSTMNGITSLAFYPTDAGGTNFAVGSKIEIYGIA